MAKASIPGRAKTRLVPPLTFTEAADFNTAFLRDVADNIAAGRARGADPRLCGIRAAQVGALLHVGAFAVDRLDRRLVPELRRLPVRRDRAIV